jgi:D-alanyl-D-alanine dipeptidase
MNCFSTDFPIEVDLIYAKKHDPLNQFSELYHNESKLLWVHKDLASITLLASTLAERLFGWTLRLYDSLRPVEAQQKMAEYHFPPSLVSLPGVGAHPRAMAIDLAPFDSEQNVVEMGTVFDYFALDPDNYNPASRDHVHFTKDIIKNRRIWENRQRLSFVMYQAAALTEQEILVLPQEWWDYRFPPKQTERFAPLQESDLLPYQRLVQPDLQAVEEILKGHYPHQVGMVLDQVHSQVTTLSALL